MSDIKINLGSGKKQYPGSGMINIDIKDFGQDYILNLEKDKLPFTDNSVDYIRADHFLEHLRDCKNALNESWRVLKKEGTMEIYVPYGLYENVFSPVHKQIITPYWFRWLEKDDCDELYDYKRWKIKELTIAKNKKGQKYEIHCKMQPVK